MIKGKLLKFRFCNAKNIFNSLYFSIVTESLEPFPLHPPPSPPSTFLSQYQKNSTNKASFQVIWQKIGNKREKIGGPPPPPIPMLSATLYFSSGHLMGGLLVNWGSGVLLPDVTRRIARGEQRTQQPPVQLKLWPGLALHSPTWPFQPLQSLESPLAPETGAQFIDWLQWLGAQVYTV